MNKMFLFDFFANVWFLIRISWIFFSEFFTYFIQRDYKGFIMNIAKELSAENILYVKVFQAISMEHNLIDETIQQELIQYTDSAPCNAVDIDWETIVRLKTEFGIVLKSTIPVNAGMISIVYESDDDLKIVKIKRTNIDEKLKSAIDRILFLLKLFSWFPRMNQLDLLHIVFKIISSLDEQLDFRKEIENTNKTAELCKFIKYIKVPVVYANVTKSLPNVIVMEKIKGQHISKVSKEDYESYAMLVMKYGFISTFIHGFTHGDLHAGNILFIKNTVVDKKTPMFQLGLIDFGIMLSISDKIKNIFLNLSTEMFSKPPILLAQKLLSNFIDTFVTLPEHHQKKLVGVVANIIETSLDKSCTKHQIKIYDLLWEVNSYLDLNNKELSEYNLKLNDDFVKIQMGIAMSHGVCMSLCNYNYVEFADRVVNDLLHIEMMIPYLRDE
jgi:predicted unusual protein kinase regulating ubiquinone biosynthesis (AarF/ABC1/UbiB family)